MSLAKKVLGKFSSITESKNKPVVSINEEYPEELKGLNQLKDLGDKLSALGFDVQRTNFGAPESNVSNRDARLKSPDYVVFVLRGDGLKYKSAGSALYVLSNGKRLYGSDYDFSQASWKAITEGSKIWFLKRTDTVSTKELRKERVLAKDGATALKLQSSRKEYEKQIADYMEEISNNEKRAADRAAKGEIEGYWGSEQALKDAERAKGYLESFLSGRDKNGGYVTGINKYRKLLAEIKLKANADQFDELTKDGKLVDQMKEWIDARVAKQIQYFKDTIETVKKPNKEDRWYDNNYNEARVIDDISREVRKMMEYLEEWMKSGELTARYKEEVLALLKK